MNVRERALAREAPCTTPLACTAELGGEHCWHQHCIGGRECCGCGERDLVPPGPDTVVLFRDWTAR